MKKPSYSSVILEQFGSFDAFDQMVMSMKSDGESNSLVLLLRCLQSKVNKISFPRIL